MQKIKKKLGGLCVGGRSEKAPTIEDTGEMPAFPRERPYRLLLLLRLFSLFRWFALWWARWRFGHLGGGRDALWEWL